MGEEKSHHRLKALLCALSDFILKTTLEDSQYYSNSTGEENVS